MALYRDELFIKYAYTLNLHRFDEYSKLFLLKIFFFSFLLASKNHQA